MAFTLVVRMTAREGEQERAAQLIPRLVEASSAEPGNLQYVAHRDPEDPRVFLMYEQYRDKAAFEQHGASDHFKELALGELFPLMEERRREIYETLE
jgi:quinol monooxygenase YgiN